MSGPEWGYLAVDEQDEIKGSTSDFMWSEDSQFLAFVKLHVEDVPNRQGVEGLTFRVGVMRMSDSKIRYSLANKRLSEIKLMSLTSDTVTASINGEPKSVGLNSIDWNSR